MALEVLAVLRRSARTFSRPLMTSYSALKSRFTSTASFLGGRSRTWPMEAFTRKSLPRYLLIVFALAGDSTITRDFESLAIRQVPSCRACRQDTAPAQPRCLSLTLCRKLRYGRKGRDPTGDAGWAPKGGTPGWLRLTKARQGFPACQGKNVAEGRKI